MSKFAANAPASKKAAVVTTNVAGGHAYRQSAKTELVTRLLTSMVADQAYTSQAQNIKATEQLVEQLVASGDAEFVAKAALYGRTHFHLRSISHLVAGALAPHARSAPWKRKFYDRIVQRPDDAVEIISYIKATQKKIPNAVKRGIGDALARFDQYAIAKYRGGSGKMKLVDVVNLVHPPHSPAIGSLVLGSLEAADTWEVGLTRAGSDPEAKARVWSSLIEEDKLGYMAMLRNLRNIKEYAPACLGTVLSRLADAERVSKSKQLPFRFWSAMRVALKEKLGADVIRALDTALAHSCANVPRFEGRTLVAVDLSGSMSARVSGGRSEITCSEVAKMLGVILAQANDATLVCFADRAAEVPVHPTDSIMGQIGNLGRASGIGGGTDFSSIFRWAGTKQFDRIVILTDNESWRHGPGMLDNYRAGSGCNPFIYLCQLATTGTVVFNPNNPRFFQLAGFSDKLFDLMAAAEVGVDTLVNHVHTTQI